ncbi:MAG: hypothetical protein ACXVPQ_10145 [Bacteroidia bacterium]
MRDRRLLLIRYNTENTGTLFWRVVIDGEEHLADSISILVPSHTSQDTLPDGRVKFHISCYYNELVWEEKKLTVK